MKRSELHAFAAAGGLVLIAILFFVGVYLNGATSYWAGALGAIAQALLAVLAGWGLMLARQQRDLGEGPGLHVAATPKTPSLGSFRMSSADDEPVSTREARQRGGDEDANEVRTLEAGFQRTVVGLAAAGLIAVVAIILMIVSRDFSLIGPGRPIQAVREGAKFENVDVILAVGGLIIYFAIYWIARGNSRRSADGEALSGMLLMGMPGMIAVTASIILAWLGASYVVQVAALIVVLMLVAEAVELLINAFRSYAGVEELDQPPIDLQATPLTPMLTSAWIGGLRSLLSQSVGIRKDHAHDQPGVLVRVLPRIIVAVLVLGFLATSARVVRPGEVAIRERLGYASQEDIDHPLQSGLHFTMPWPIDELAVIPTQQVHKVTVGAEDKPAEFEGQTLDVTFWAIKHTVKDENEDEYITADQQLLGTTVNVWWRVKDPSKFYRGLSHNEFVEIKTVNGQTKTEGRPIYEKIIESFATRTVTQNYAQHSLDQILATGRQMVQDHCKQDLQKILDDPAIDAGIEIVDLTIQDVHPPVGLNGRGVDMTANGPVYGPAAAYEAVVMGAERREATVDQAQTEVIIAVEGAHGERDQTISQAQSYSAVKVNTAIADSAWLSRVTEAMNQATEAYRAPAPNSGAQPVSATAAAAQSHRLVEGYYENKALFETLPNVTKVLLGEGVPAPILVQAGKSSDMQMVPVTPAPAPAPSNGAPR